jgi:hypothetical protein
MMPYISPNRRADFYELEMKVLHTRIDSPGELNYIITQLFLKYMSQHGLNYQSINDCLGAASGAMLEMYRRVAVKLEDKKCEENGDVYDVFEGEK